MQPATRNPKKSRALRALVMQPAVALPAAPPFPALELLRSGHPIGAIGWKSLKTLRLVTVALLVY
jgi:hypothetical protein